jgi:uncharacterized protein with HEPN domain
MTELDPRASDLLNDIYTSAKRIVERLQKETLESFSNESSMDVQDIVAWRLAIVGEASSVLLKKYPEFCERHPEIPLQQARRMRNILVHDYNRIIWQVVWDTAQGQLPQLIDAIEPFLLKQE